MNSESRQQTNRGAEQAALNPRRSSVKLVLGRLLFSGAKLLSAVLPGPVFVALGRRVGFLSSFFLPREFSFAIAQISFALRISDPEEARRIARQAFAHIGESLCEIVIFDRLLTKRIVSHSADCNAVGSKRLLFEHIDAQGTECVYELLDAGKPAIALSAHLGCVELLAGYFVSIGAKMSVVTRVPHYSGMAELFRAHREKFSIDTLWKGDGGSAMKMVRQLKQGGVVAGLIDQDMNEENVFSSFFGVPAATPAALIRVAIKYNLAILTSFIVRTGPLKHLVITERLDWQGWEGEASASLSDAQLQVLIIDEYHRRLEALIKRYPEQWVWWHRRWRRRPGEDPAKPRSATEYLAWLQSITEHTNQVGDGSGKD